MLDQQVLTKRTSGDFFDNLQSVLERYHFEAKDIYNCDETGLTTVQRPPNVVADRGAKQVGQVTSAERGCLVTMNVAVNAQGNFIPPFLIFPRVHFKPHMIKNAPTGTVGAAHSSGWMTSDNFEVWLDHFIKHTGCSTEHKVLLLLDNHDSHLSLAILDKAKTNGVVMLTFPPHCSHKLQPLDRSVYGPLKAFYNSACNSWQLNNPGKPMTIYDIAENLGQAFPKAFVPENIQSGFRVSGIYPYDRDVFHEDEFLSSFVSDRPESTNEEQHDNAGDADRLNEQQVERQQDADVEANNSQPSPQGNKNKPAEYYSPEVVRPYPKAAARKTAGRGRRKGRTMVLTDTPVKSQLESELAEREAKKLKAKRTLKLSPVAKRPKAAKAQPQQESSSDDDEVLANLLDHDTSDEELSDEEPVQPLLPEDTSFSVGNYVLVKFSSKKSTQHSVGKLLYIFTSQKKVRAKFLKPAKKGFLDPEEEDIYDVSIDDIIMKLPQPTPSGGTLRASQFFSFSVDLTSFHCV